MDDIQALRQAVAELKEQVGKAHQKIAYMRKLLDQEYDYAAGHRQAMQLLVFHLLHGHPHSGLIQAALAKKHARYQELLAHPERAQDGEEKAEQLEASSHLYRALTNAGVWGAAASSPSSAAQTRRTLREPPQK